MQGEYEQVLALIYHWHLSFLSFGLLFLFDPYLTVHYLCRLFCSMICSDPKLDSHRFKDILDEAIAAGVYVFKLQFRSEISETLVQVFSLRT